MQKKDVLKIEFTPVFEMWAWRITYQNEEVLKRGDFKDGEIKVCSVDDPFFSKISKTLYIMGKKRKFDDVVNICGNEVKEIIEEKVKQINEKYGIEKRWRAERGGTYWFLDSAFDAQACVDTRCFWDIARYDVGNYFQTKELVENCKIDLIEFLKDWHSKHAKE